MVSHVYFMSLFISLMIKYLFIALCSYVLDINECESRPCMNNGTCIDGLNNYNCQCEAGYTGLNCEIGKC